VKLADALGVSLDELAGRGPGGVLPTGNAEAAPPTAEPKKPRRRKELPKDAP
jgi:hypothetical protein